MAVVAGIPIHEAAWTGNVDRIKELSLEASSLIKCVYSFVRKILFICVCSLLDERGYTPLHCAAENGSLESVKVCYQLKHNSV